jgi:hypothetical protein
MYCSVDTVRKMSHFTDTTRVSDNEIVRKIVRASSMVDGYMAKRYSLPLSYHLSVTITMSGTGTGTGTLALVIGGVTYNVAVTSGLTASNSANLLRTALRDSAVVFVPDDAQSGVVVNLVSITDSSDLTTATTEVTAVGGTQSGITATVGTIVKRYPPLVEELTASLATGLLLLDNYGTEEQGTSRDGKIRIDLALSTLKMIQGVSEVDASIIVQDEVTRQPLLRDMTPEIQSYPNTSSTASGYTEPTFSVNDRF